MPTLTWGYVVVGVFGRVRGRRFAMFWQVFRTSCPGQCSQTSLDPPGSRLPHVHPGTYGVEPPRPTGMEAKAPLTGESPVVSRGSVC